MYKYLGFLWPTESLWLCSLKTKALMTMSLINCNITQLPGIPWLWNCFFPHWINGMPLNFSHHLLKIQWLPITVSYSAAVPPSVPSVPVCTSPFSFGEVLCRDHLMEMITHWCKCSTKYTKGTGQKHCLSVNLKTETLQTIWTLYLYWLKN